MHGRVVSSQEESAMFVRLIQLCSAGLLVFENDKGEVWTAYTDFGWIARRHGVKNRSDQFKMASSVIASVTSSVKAK